MIGMPWWVWLLVGFALAWLPSLAIVVILLRRAPYCPDELDVRWRATNLDDGGPAREPLSFDHRTDRAERISRNPAVDERPEILN